jgi:2-polyprenyl-3-methyl-5-hydroxy-6-metoxy-1,4-benzoquinol methylase
MAKFDSRINFGGGMEPAAYWESRACRFASNGDGLAAVCSYGMPGFYNRAIHFCQYRALVPFLKQSAGKSVLDIGCGVGRWSVWMARHGAWVTGADISPTMVREAERRATAAGVSSRCTFLVSDLVELNLDASFDLILGVTVLQHVLDRDRLQRVVSNLKDRLAPDGQIVLIEAAPSRPNSRCNTPIFVARNEGEYRELFEQNGFGIHLVRGVDPMPLKTLLLPRYSKLPKFISVSLLAAATGISLPVDALFGRWWVKASWHKLFVLRRVGA